MLGTLPHYPFYQTPRCARPLPYFKTCFKYVRWEDLHTHKIRCPARPVCYGLPSIQALESVL